MLRLIRIALQVLIFFMLLSVVVAIAAAGTGTLEKGALLGIGALLVLTASAVRRLGRPHPSFGGQATPT